MELTEWIKNIIINIEDNDYNIIMKVYPGSAGFVARIIKERALEDIIMVIDNNDSLLILPKNMEAIKNISKKLKEIFFIK